MNNVQVGVKISEKGVSFLDRLRTNRRKEGTDDRDLGYAKLVETVYQYFKTHDKSYKELLKQEYVKDA